MKTFLSGYKVTIYEGGTRAGQAFPNLSCQETVLEPFHLFTTLLNLFHNRDLVIRTAHEGGIAKTE